MDSNRSLVPKPPGAIEKMPPGAHRLLSGVAADTFALARAQESGAIFNRGKSFYLGDGVRQDYEAAANYFREAAEKGHAGAQIGLSICYRLGRCCRQRNFGRPSAAIAGSVR
jgi:TPR repeat protein